MAFFGVTLWIGSLDSGEDEVKLSCQHVLKWHSLRENLREFYFWDPSNNLQGREKLEKLKLKLS